MKDSSKKKCSLAYSSQAAREVGCPLDHCQCGTHDSRNEEHSCPELEDQEYDPMGYLED
jgi:hypothetical protein